MNKEHYLNIFEKYTVNKATEQEIRELLSFLRADLRLHQWFEHQVENSPSEISEDLKQKMLNKIKEGIDDTKKSEISVKKLYNKWMRIAAAIILPVLIAGGSYYFCANHTENGGNPLLIAAERGEKANITLPDGSRVWLNSGSKLTCYNTYNKDRRLLQLDGEAYFEVIPDARKKFIVQCTDMTIEVLGTTFGVKAYNEDSIVSTVLVEGKVKITIPDKSWEIAPNERVVFNRSSSHVFSETVNPSDFTGWRKNRLRFENETLQDVVKTIARIHNINYDFADESIKSLRFTGTVDNTNLESTLDAITLTAPVTYFVKDSIITFYKDDNKKKHFD
jgi:ferric-dicitrate binding protein FerR (iron transport regulator)